MHHIKCDTDISHACRHTCGTWTLHMLKALKLFLKKKALKLDQARTFSKVLVDYYYITCFYYILLFCH